MIEVDVDDVRCTLEAAFVNAGAQRDTARIVVGALVEAELEGYASHGILRGVEYLDEIAAKRLDPSAAPIARTTGGSVELVDGRRAFGALTARFVAERLVALTSSQPVAVVGLRNACHIGRLAEVGKRVAANDRIVIGFSNFQGQGQKALPWNGSEPRLCTNPLLFACPRANGNAPLVIDFSSTVVSEGSIRSLFQAGLAVPKGWLVDANWQDVTDPAPFYASPMRAFLRPLGGDAGHKGFMLGLMAEVLGGLLTCAGDIAAPGPPGNGGLFVALKPSLFGGANTAYHEAIERLVSYVCDAAPRQGTAGVELPGERSKQRREACAAEGVLRIAEHTWATIRAQAKEYS